MTTDWNTPSLTDTYTNFLSFIKARDVNIAKLDFTGDTNIPDNFKRYNTSNDKFENTASGVWTKLGFHTPIDNHIADTSLHVPVPTGAGILWYSTVIPSGWLLCDGTAVSRTTYAALFGVIGTTWGVGDGSTTFNVPNLKERFPLGKNSTGSYQTLSHNGGLMDHFHTAPVHTHTIASHTHTMANHVHVGASHSHSIPAHTHTVPAHFHSVSASGANINIVSSGNHSHTIQTFTNTGGSGNRVRGMTDGQSAVDFTSVAATHIHSNADFVGNVGNVTSANSGDGSLTSGSGGSGTTGVDGAGATTIPFPNTSDGTALTTDNNTVVSTGTSNPPYLIVNYIIKT